VELSYLVQDGLGGEATASQLFVVAPTAAIDHEATGTLRVTGTPAEGGFLVVDLPSAADADGAIAAVAYEWQQHLAGSWVALDGPAGNLLVIPEDQSYVDREVRVVATTTDIMGGTTVFESMSQLIANLNDLPTGDTLQLGQALVGKAITVQASYTDGHGTAESVGSMATAPVAAMPGLALTGTSGADSLTGGAGADRFEFDAITDSSLGAGADLILDFLKGSDSIACAV